MHVSFHYATGIIAAIIYSQFYPIAWWSFGIVLIGAIIADSDYIFSKLAPDHNHRMLPTHSIFFPIPFIILGLLVHSPLVVAASLAYLTHPIIDLFDWGTNCFLNGKIVGSRVLLAKSEYLIVPELMKQEKDPKWFFAKRYYHSKIVVGLEIFAFMLMVVGMGLLTPQYWYFIIGYILVLGLHMYEFYTLRNRNSR